MPAVACRWARFGANANDSIVGFFYYLFRFYELTDGQEIQDGRRYSPRELILFLERCISVAVSVSRLAILFSIPFCKENPCVMRKAKIISFYR
jgi:hypothetical protein